MRNQMRSRVLEVFESVDLVLTPCNSTVAFPVDADAVAVGTSGDTVVLSEPGGQSRLTTWLTLPWNLTGVPAVSIPSSSFSEGLPIAIQLAAAPLGERPLLRAASSYESAVGGFPTPIPTIPSRSDGLLA